MAKSLRKLGRLFSRSLRGVVKFIEKHGVAEFVRHHKRYILVTYRNIRARGVPEDEAVLATIRALLRHAL